MNIEKAMSIRKEILKYGGPILKTKEFRDATLQSHHIHTTVAFHSLNVAIVSILISRILAKFGIKTNTKVLILSALCHDLGIVREFTSRREECWMHPILSAEIASGLIENCDEKILSAIRTHMWPVVPGRPRSKEGYILTISDKIVAIREFLCPHPYHFNKSRRKEVPYF